MRKPLRRRVVRHGRVLSLCAAQAADYGDPDEKQVLPSSVSLRVRMTILVVGDNSGGNYASDH